MNLNSLPMRAGHAALNLIQEGRGITTAERVERLNALEVEEAGRVLASLPQQKAVPVLSRPELHNAADIVTAIPPDQAAKLLNATANDRVADILLEMDEDARGVLVARLDATTRLAIQNLM